ncbi:MAG: formate/nitrite transporter family protein, partial [Bacteroidales bacterium]|nr:formate/nitrite transporter family protein [Bacteroidales bacterium]
KMKKETVQFYIQSMLAGALIALGDMVYIVNENRIVGSFLFALGLISILLKGYPLYTGRIGYVESLRDLWKPVGGMLPIIVMNFVGIAIVGSLGNITRLDLSGIEPIVATKINQTWYSALFLSWGCGAMMYLAVNGWRKTQHPLSVIMPIMFFILCGFEHCIANYGYFWIWITADGFAHCAERFAELPMGFCSNLLIMIVGNALGSLTFSKN